jgi:hypothetical protein
MMGCCVLANPALYVGDLLISERVVGRVSNIARCFADMQLQLCSQLRLKLAQLCKLIFPSFPCEVCPFFCYEEQAAAHVCEDKFGSRSVIMLGKFSC